ncbi:FeS-binding protein (modular protein) [Flavobacterium sp. 9AF]|uniref:4Fe-4S binding protein n=1 Tax=Flavobacterium sp. 9AF TaxID=2653142 RepID=UPI0012F0EAA7|nr:4Fe-4S dicluster domain-containing protein [Flavobacterium sp. 9AF]VXA93472.1 FeS-binding protein (modular protein) [Flavobacterium sp. 9AF]
MKILKTLRLLGLVVFIASVLIFIGTLFIGGYALTEKTIETVFSSKTDYVTTTLKDVAKEKGILNKEMGNAFVFTNEIESLLENYNTQVTTAIAKEKGLSEEEINQIFKQSIQDDTVVYSKEILQNVFPNDAAKVKLVDEATNWMYVGTKKYEKAADFKNDFTSKISDINRNNAQEYLIYPNKYTKFDLVKASIVGPLQENNTLYLFLTFGLGIIGALMFILTGLFLEPIPGIKNNGIYLSEATNRGWVALFVFAFLVSFYILLYFYPFYIVNWTRIVDPLKGVFIKGASASQWFLYGILYCVSMIVMGVRMFIKYRHNAYQIVRTASVLFFQIIFAFLLVEILPLFDLPGVDLKNAWPLDYNFVTDWNVKQHLEAGHLGKFMLVWGVVLSLIVVPVMVYLYGKRWYCSWVCGCGGLAETLGDPYRQLSDKRLIAWKIERWTIYPILVFAVIMTLVVGYNTYNIVYNPSNVGDSTLFGINAYKINEIYGFLIGSIFAGVIGTGFYPILGNRSWCRFGCPLAAYMGIIQRFKSRFRITTNGGQCISCGNCSTYCEQGIDVRAYAQKGENIVRASCVGCGVCAAVCPRGVLKLENSTEKGRINPNEILLGNDLDLMDLVNQK